MWKKRFYPKRSSETSKLFQNNSGRAICKINRKGGEALMKHGKRPTKREKIHINSYNLNAED
ncbi:DUF6906 family protein, partial [Bacillus cereus]|uniref:DUF6906 family protein n=1 Tax=Bacillus cereus TaxID=1396 RepID=UPI003F775B92